MAKKSGLIAALIAGLLLAWCIAMPWITVSQIRTAAQDRDGQALAQHVDFDSVRASLKDQLNALVLRKMGNEGKELNPLAALVAPLAGAVVNKMVDAYATPAGVAQLLAGDTPREAGPSPQENTNAGPGSTDEDGPRRAKASMAYRGMNRFVVTSHGRRGDTQFVLGRRGLTWKLTEIILPPQ